MKDIERLKTFVNYDLETGIFTWKVNRNSYGGKVKIGCLAGTKDIRPNQGYITIGIEKKLYRAHRLAWLFVNGEFPEKGFEIDHINGVRHDNRLCNLRLVTRTQNNMNAIPRSDNKLGHRGVSYQIRRDTWDSRITLNKKTICLGQFKTKEEAITARQKAEKMYFDEFSIGNSRP